MRAFSDCVLCPYTDWPLIRVTPEGAVERWANDSAGATAVLAERDRIALVGGYDGNRDRVVIGTLVGGVLRVDSVGRRTLGGGEWHPTHVIGHNGTLHAFVDARWHSVTFRSLAGGLSEA